MASRGSIPRLTKVQQLLGMQSIFAGQVEAASAICDTKSPPSSVFPGNTVGSMVNSQEAGPLRRQQTTKQLCNLHIKIPGPSHYC
jgi:hypothetical protein